MNVRETKKLDMVKAYREPREIYNVALIRKGSRHKVLEVLDAGLDKEFALDDVGRF